MKIVKKKRSLGFDFDISRISKDLKIATAAADKVTEAFNKKAIKLPVCY